MDLGLLANRWNYIFILEVFRNSYMRGFYYLAEQDSWTYEFNLIAVYRRF
jgi:hypothetical protein